MSAFKRMGLSCLVGLFAAISPVVADSLTWNGTTGNAVTTSKWSPQQLPTNADDLFFPGATTFTITFDNQVPASLSQTFRNTVNATVNITGTHTVGGTLDVGTFSGDDPTVHLGIGSLDVGGTVTLGFVTG